jgi:ppGpp synthetase/RelA/SpoT-type nucleotidyltranferase
MDVVEIEKRYANDRPLYARLAEAIAEKLRMQLATKGVVCRIEHRAKDPASLIKKLIVKGKQYDEIGDRAGVRLVLALPTDREAAIACIRSAVTVVAEEDKRAKLEPGEFAYGGMHFEATLGPPAGIRCEVQLHTPGEALWASVTHDLAYKALLPMPYAAERALFRMRALTEVFDSEVERVAGVLEELMVSAEALTLKELEPRFLRLAQRPYNAELSVAVIRQLLSGQVANDVVGKLSKFCDDNADRLAGIFTKYAESTNPLLTQPEAMLIFCLLDADAFAVRESWNGLPVASLEEFEAIWGVVGSG